MKINKKIFFENKIKKIKKSWIREYLLVFLDFRSIIFRISHLLIVALICGLCFFLIRHYSLIDSWSGLRFNKGFALGVGHDWPIWLGYFIKILPCVLAFILWIFSSQWYIQISISLVFINGLYNVIDKCIVDTYLGVEYLNTVVDNIKWEAFGFTNNIADIFIIIGAISLVLGYIYVFYLWYKTRDKESAKNQEDIKKEENRDKEHENTPNNCC